MIPSAWSEEAQVQEFCLFRVTVVEARMFELRESKSTLCISIRHNKVQKQTRYLPHDVRLDFREVFVFRVDANLLGDVRFTVEAWGNRPSTAEEICLGECEVVSTRTSAHHWHALRSGLTIRLAIDLVGFQNKDGGKEDIIPVDPTFGSFYDSFGRFYSNVDTVEYQLSMELTSLVRQIHYDFWKKAVESPPSRIDSDTVPCVWAGVPEDFRKDWYILVSKRKRGARRTSIAPTATDKKTYWEWVERSKDKDDVNSEQIAKDIHRTISSEHRTAINSTEGQDKMHRILRAYAAANPTIGYCQAMNFITAQLLVLMDNIPRGDSGILLAAEDGDAILHMQTRLILEEDPERSHDDVENEEEDSGEEEAFLILGYICEYILTGYYEQTMSGVMVDLKAFESLFLERLPDLASHFEKMDITASIIVMQWFLAIYVPVFPTETVFRIFDALLIEGRGVLFAVAVAFFQIYSNEILMVEDNESVMDIIKQRSERMFDHHLLMEVAKQEWDRWGSTLRSRRNGVREEMRGKLEDKIRQHTVSSLVRLPSLSLNQIDSIYDMFAQVSSSRRGSCVRSDSVTGGVNLDYRGMDETAFETFVKSLVPDCPDEMRHRMFQAFDFNEDGRIDVAEMVCCIGLLTLEGTFQDRAQACFRAFDIDNNGRIDRAELLQMFSVMLMLTYGTKFPENTVQMIMRRSLRDNNLDKKDALDFNEFALFSQSQPLIRSMLENCLPVKTRSLGTDESAGIEDSGGSLESFSIRQLGGETLRTDASASLLVNSPPPPPSEGSSTSINFSEAS